VGAGDVETIAGWARSEWAAGGAGPGAAPLPPLPGARVDEPLAPRTTFRVGGCADVYVELADAAALAGALRWTRAAGVPFTLMGGGCNVLVSDLGVRGVVARLTGPVFTGLRREGGEAVVGAAVPMARLTAWLEQEQLGGAEFLEGVPGTVGGALRMNAGAWGHAIGERVAWVRGVDRDGTERRFEAADMDFGYRHCGALRERVAVEAGLRLWPADPAAIRAERAAIAAKRGWMKGIRSAGSVFRNPPGGYAGKLIEEAGLKGDAIGGARIMERHANVIAADEGATASDVLALIERMRATVRAHSGVTLEPEVVLME
jgi:UDP-N-acetylmuramate dehydrogenase